MSWHLCERWYAGGFDCAYHRVVIEEEEKEDEDEEEEDKPLWPIPVPARASKPPSGGSARASVSDIVDVTVPYIVAVEPPVYVPEPTGGVGQFGGNKGPVYVPAPGVAFEPLMDPRFVPAGGVGSLVPGGLPPPATVPGAGIEFNIWDNPTSSGIKPADALRAIGVALAATIVIVIVARAPPLARPIVALGGRLPPLPFFPLFEGVRKYAANAERDLALAEWAVIDSINESLDLSMLYQADYKERILQNEQTAAPDEPAPQITQANSPPLLFNAINKMAAFQLPPTAEFDWRSVGLERPP